MTSELYYAYLSVMARNSPLNALRTLDLTACQLRRLVIFCRVFGHHDLAGLVSAEADMREMLTDWRRRCLNPN